MPPPLRLSDAELDAILDAARPLPIEARDTFLRAVAHRLQQECGELGPGSVSRACRALQQDFFDPPIISEPVGWDRRIRPRRRATAEG
jgi:hypothetical protein